MIEVLWPHVHVSEVSETCPSSTYPDDVVSVLQCNTTDYNHCFLRFGKNTLWTMSSNTYRSPPAIRLALEGLSDTLDATHSRTLLGIEKARNENLPTTFFSASQSPFARFASKEPANVLAACRPSRRRRRLAPRGCTASCVVCLFRSDHVGDSLVVQFFPLLSKRIPDVLSPCSILAITSSLIPPMPSFFPGLLSASFSVLVTKSTKAPIYAARCLVDHGKFQGVSSSIQDLMERLFDPDRPYFAAWVWIYDLGKYPWRRCIRRSQRPSHYTTLHCVVSTSSWDTRVGYCKDILGTIFISVRLSDRIAMRANIRENEVTKTIHTCYRSLNLIMTNHTGNTRAIKIQNIHALKGRCGLV